VGVGVGDGVGDGVGVDAGVGDGDGEGEPEPEMVTRIVAEPAALVMVTVQVVVALPVRTNVVPGEPVIVSEPEGHVVVIEAGPSAAGIESVSAFPMVRASAFFAPSGTGAAVTASAVPVPSGATGVPDPPPPQAVIDSPVASVSMPARILYALSDTIRRSARNKVHSDSLPRIMRRRIESKIRHTNFIVML
jgi:hypothetical protein